MSITGAIVLYAISWFMTLFCVLPFRTQSQDEANHITPGTPPGAPARSMTEPGLRRLEILYRERRADSLRLAHLLVGDRARAEELVHDAFLRVLPRIDELDNPAGYLRIVLVNACRDAGRRATRASAVATGRA